MLPSLDGRFQDLISINISMKGLQSMKEEEGIYLLQFQVDEAMDHETEWFYHLQHALVRLTYLSQICRGYLVACILYQSRTGDLYDVCEFDLRSGFGFESERIDFDAS